MSENKYERLLKSVERKETNSFILGFEAPAEEKEGIRKCFETLKKPLKS